MQHIATCLGLCLFFTCSTSASGQVSLHLPDLSVTPVASGLAQAGDLAVDGTGNVWLVAAQGAIGGSGGSLTRVTPQGVVVPNAVTGLSQVGDLVLGNDGNVYFWMNVAATTTALMQLTPAGTLATVATFPGFLGAGIAQDAAGNFYLGANPQGGSGIYQLSPGSSSLSFFAIGIDPGALATEQTHLSIDGQGTMFVATESEVAEVTSPVSTTTLYYAIPCLAPFCPPVIRDLEAGYYGGLLTFTYFTIINNSTQLLGIRGAQAIHPVADFGPEFSQAHAALGRGVSNDYYAIDRSGNLYRISGSPATLTLSIQVPNQLRLDVQAPAGSPFVLAADVPGIEFTLPGVGTFHTSLGTGPAFTVVADGTGIFQAPDPSAVTPWTNLYPLPPMILGINVVLEAYALSGAAANPIGVMISNSVQFGF